MVVEMSYKIYKFLSIKIIAIRENFLGCDIFKKNKIQNLYSFENVLEQCQGIF